VPSQLVLPQQRPANARNTGPAAASRGAAPAVMDGKPADGTDALKIATARTGTLDENSTPLE